MSEDSGASATKSKLPAWFIILGILGFLLYVFNYQNAFPSSSLSFKIPREQIEKEAKELALELNYTKKPRMQSTVFQTDNSTILFLQHHYGPKEADKLIKEGLPCYYWSTRFCTPKELEEFTSNRTPDGRLVSLFHRIPNDLDLPSLDQQKGKEMIDAFLKKHTDLQIENFKLLSFKSERKKTRDDLSYVFEDTAAEFKGARMRLEFVVGGNEITQFKRYLHVPDSWELRYKVMRSYNATINVVFWLFHYLMLAAAFLYLLNMLVLRTVRWKFAIRASAVLSFLGILAVVANAPSILHYYSTELPEFTYVIALLAAMLQIGASTFIGNVALFAPGEAIYRKLWGKGILLDDLVSWKGIRSAQFRNGIILGLATCGISQGWQNLYYWIGGKFGVSTPLGLERPEILGSYAPFVNLISLGASASFTEEIAYRVVFLLVAQRFLKNFWLANFLQAFVWSLGHTGYPQSPFWARIAELTVGGFIDGMIFQYFGVLPGLVGHYLFDSFLPMLFKASDWQLVVSGVLGIVPPFVFLLVSRMFAGKSMKFDEPVEAEKHPVESAVAEPQVGELEEPPVQLVAEPESAQPSVSTGKTRFRVAAWIATILLLPASIAMLFVIKQDPLSLQVSGAEAEQMARDYVQKIGLNDPGLKICLRKLKTDSNDQANQCLQDKLGKEKMHEIFEKVWSPQLWWVRFCGEQQIKELVVKVDASRNRVFGLTLKLPDDDKGARLSKDDAIKKVQQFINEYHSDLQPIKSVGSKSFDRENRTDYTTQWESSKIGSSDVKLRMECSTMGDVVSGFSTYWELPDKWQFNYQEITPRRGVATFGFLLFLLAGVIMLIIWLLKVPRSSAPGFRYIASFIGLIAGLSLILRAHLISTLMANYDSQTPYVASVVQTVCYQFADSIPMFCFLGVALVLASDAGAQFVPGDRMRALHAQKKDESETATLDTKIILGVACGTIAALSFGGALRFAGDFSTEAVVSSYDLTAFLAEAVSPGFFALTLALISAILGIPILGVVYGFLHRYLEKRKWLFYLVAVLLSVSIAGMTRHSHDILLLAVLFLTGILVLRWMIYKIFRHNPLSFAVAVYVFVMLGALSQFLVLARPLLLGDAIISLVALVMGPALLYVVLRSRSNRNQI